MYCINLKVRSHKEKGKTLQHSHCQGDHHGAGGDRGDGDHHGHGGDDTADYDVLKMLTMLKVVIKMQN